VSAARGRPDLLANLWYSPAPAWRLARLLLAPLSLLYWLALYLRNAAWDSGLLRARSVGLPVLCVGNINSGGTGKTPLVIWLVDSLKKRGYTAVVVSRGYGSSGDVDRVDAVRSGAGSHRSADEALLVARRCDCTVVTAADRVAACRLAEREAGVDLLILDDGFQHRRLARDLDLVLLAVGDRDARLLPRGPLREPASALRRADIIVENAGGESGPMVSRRPVGLVDRVSSDAEPGSLERLRGQRVVVICGIADPAAFVDMLVSCAASVEEVYAFADHHEYELGDLDPLRQAQRSGALLLTTEKDLVKLEVFVDEEFSPLALRLGLEVEGGPALLDSVVDALDLKERGPHHQRSGAPLGDAGINK